MLQQRRIGVAIPAFNEEAAIARVIEDLPTWVDTIVVADNGSSDNTADVARAAGAKIVSESERGYGAACLAAIAELEDTDIIVFVDGDYSDYPEDAADLVEPILDGRADLVIGSRTLGKAEKGALTPQQVFGNWLATRLIALIWGQQFTDLGPFRAIRTAALAEMAMRDRNFGWTVEMQIKAAQMGLRCEERAVRYRKRIGQSKISGTIQGTIRAGTKIIGLIVWSAMRPATPRNPTNQDRQRLKSGRGQTPEPALNSTPRN
ncbi:MAG: glycosyltransferase family 2 protein [Pseudomonadota bacterium]